VAKIYLVDDGCSVMPVGTEFEPALTATVEA
jgi:hypothetical protein